MKSRGRVHYWIILLLIGFFICSFYVSNVTAVTVADWQMADQLEGRIFTFLEENIEDFKLEIRSDKVMADHKDETEERKRGILLDGFLELNKKTLCISGTEPIDLKDFHDGSVSLTISYALCEKITEKDKNTVTLSGIKTGVCDLGNIPLFLSVDKPYWRIANKNGAWGVGLGDKSIPEEIYKIIPQNITGLLGYNNITSIERGILKGTVNIGNFQKNQTALTSVIHLSSLHLPKKIYQQVVANGEKCSTLEIMANYYFSLPVILDQNTSREYLNTEAGFDYKLLSDLPRIQGKVTLRNHIKVIHDVESLDIENME